MTNIEEKRIDIKTEQSMPEVEKFVTSLPDFEAQLNGAKDLNTFTIHKFSDNNGDGYFFYKDNKPLFCIPGKESFISILTDFYNSQQKDAEKYALSVDDQLNLLKIETLAKSMPTTPELSKQDINTNSQENKPIQNEKKTSETKEDVPIDTHKQETDSSANKEQADGNEEKTDTKDSNQNQEKKSETGPITTPLKDKSELISLLDNKNQADFDKVQLLTIEVKKDLELMKKEINSWKWEDFKDMKAENQKKEFRNQYKTQIDERLKQIQDIEHALDLIKKGTIPEDKQPERLKQLSSQAIALSDDAETINVAIGDLSLGKIPNVPQFSYILTTKGDARRLQRSLAKNNEKIKNMNVELQGAAGERLKQEDLISLKDYLNRVIDGKIDPVIQPFSPQEALAYKYLCSIDPTLESVFNGIFSRSKKSGEIPGRRGLSNGGTMDSQETYKNSTNTGGLLGLAKFGLDKTKMTPKQKEFWLGATNLAMTGALIFGGFKFFQNVFRLFSKSGREKLKDGGWAWIAAPFALTFGSQALTGKGPLELLNGLDIPALFGWKKGTGGVNQSSEMRDTYVTGFNGAMALFSGQTYGAMASQLEKDNEGKIKFKPDSYETLKTTLNNGSDEQKIAGKFLEYVGKDDPDHMIDLALSGMGITLEDLQNNPDAKFNDKSGDVIKRLNTLYAYMQDKNKDINPESIGLITNYIKGIEPKYSPEELDGMGAFEKKVLTISPEEKERLRGLVDQMGITDPKEKENILNGLYQFYEDWPTADSYTRDSIRLEKTSNRIYLETYGQKTEVNLHERTLPGLNQRGTTYNLKFASTKELLNVANLTNRIKGITRGHEAKSTSPFGLSLGGVGVPFTDVGGAITFDKSSRYEVWKPSDTMISGKNIDIASPTLAKQKKEFVEGYLNKRWQHKNEMYYTPITSEVFEAVGGAAVITGAAGVAGLSYETPDQKAAREKKEAEDKASIEKKNNAEKMRIEAESQARLDGLSQELDNLVIEGMNETQKKDLKEAFKEFYNTLGKNSVPPMEVSVSDDGKTLNLSSYGQTSVLDFYNMKLENLDIKFGTYTKNNYKELFNVANLSNQILDATKDKKPLEGDFTMFEKVVPFVPLGITFNNADVLSTQRDLRVASGSDLSSLSEALKKEANVDLFVDYLNDHWLKNNLSEEENTRLKSFHSTIDGLTITDEKKKNKIKSDFDQFFITLGNKVQPPLELSGLGENKLKLKSYGFDKTIDFSTMKLDTLNITLKKPGELFRLANLTNNILLVTTDKQHNEDFDPFKSADHVGIFFNDQEIFSPNFDTRLVSGSGLNSVSKEFANAGNIDLYVKYLNYVWLNQKNGLSSLLKEGVNKEEVSEGLKLFLEKKIENAPGEVKFSEGKMISRGFATEVNLKDFSVLGIVLNKSGKSNKDAYKDLFELTDIINEAKQKANNLPGDTTNPFNISWGGMFGGDIEFDSSDSWIDHTLINYGDLKRLNPDFSKSSNLGILVDKLNARWNDGKKTGE